MPTIVTIHAAEETVDVTLGHFMQVLRNDVEAVRSKLMDAPLRKSCVDFSICEGQQQDCSMRLARWRF